MALGLSRFVCMRSFFQYPRFVTPIRLRDPTARRAPLSEGKTGTGPRASPRRAMPCTWPQQASTRIQLNDQRFLDVGAEFVAVRRLLEQAFELGRIHRHPGRHALRFGELHRIDDAQLLLRLFAHTHHVTGLDQVRGDVDDLAVDGDGLVRYQLATFGARGAEAHAVDDAVQTRFEQQQQVGAGVALAALGFRKVAAELALQDAVHALDLLLFAQLQTEVGGAGAGSAAMLARLAVELDLVTDRAARALEEQVGAFTAGEFALGA